MPKEAIGFAAWYALDHYIDNVDVKMSQKEIAAKLGVSPSTVYRWRDNPFISIDSEKITLIKELCVDQLPSQERIAEMEDEWDGVMFSDRDICYSKAKKGLVSLDDDDSWEEKNENDINNAQGCAPAAIIIFGLVLFALLI